MQIDRKLLKSFYISFEMLRKVKISLECLNLIRKLQITEQELQNLKFCSAEICSLETPSRYVYVCVEKGNEKGKKD